MSQGRDRAKKEMLDCPVAEGSDVQTPATGKLAFSAESTLQSMNE